MKYLLTPLTATAIIYGSQFIGSHIVSLALTLLLAACLATACCAACALLIIRFSRL